MAHVEKYKKSQVFGLLQHCGRWKKKNGEEYNHSNKEINPKLSELNYHLFKERGQAWEYFKRRADEVYIYGKDGGHANDINYLANWVVTLPEDVRREDEQKFWNLTFAFLAKRYGMKNIIDVNVHRDESRPHMHFSFMPIIYNEKKKREELCAKKILNRKELETFHQDLSNFVQTHLGYRVSIVGNKTMKDREKENLSIRELKEKTRIDLVVDKQILEEDIQELKQVYDEQYERTREMVDVYQNLKSQKELDEEKEKIEKEKKNIAEMKEKLQSAELLESVVDDYLKLSKQNITASQIALILANVPEQYAVKKLVRDLGDTAKKIYAHYFNDGDRSAKR